MPRALSFGSVAAAYERFRPGYPDALVDQVLTYAGRPVRTALEIGAGTGKATRAFAGAWHRGDRHGPGRRRCSRSCASTCRRRCTTSAEQRSRTSR